MTRTQLPPAQRAYCAPMCLPPGAGSMRHLCLFLALVFFRDSVVRVAWAKSTPSWERDVASRQRLCRCPPGSKTSKCTYKFPFRRSPRQWSFLIHFLLCLSTGTVPALILRWMPLRPVGPDSRPRSSLPFRAFTGRARCKFDKTVI